jgi:hypothetical protein
MYRTLKNIISTARSSLLGVECEDRLRECEQT